MIKVVARVPQPNISPRSTRSSRPSKRTARQSDVKRAIENGPTAKMTGVAVIGMTDVKTISATAEKVECTATAILNNAQQGLMNYSFTSAPSVGTGQYFIHAKVEPDSIKPYP